MSAARAVSNQNRLITRILYDEAMRKAMRDQRCQGQHCRDHQEQEQEQELHGARSVPDTDQRKTLE